MKSNKTKTIILVGMLLSIGCQKDNEKIKIINPSFFIRIDGVQLSGDTVSSKVFYLK